MIGLLMLGFLVGMRHALEADHIAAVATFVTRTRTVTGAVSHGVAWALGHTVTLFGVGSLVIVLDAELSETLAHLFEFIVGVMLVALGGDVLRRVVRDRFHVHAHAHADGTEHLHMHSHHGEGAHDARRHEHHHTLRLPVRALLVGLMHGMAGSAALILLTVGTIDSALTGIAYMALFGLGSIVGMAAVSAVIAIPMRRCADGLTWMYNGLQVAVGATTAGLGAMVIVRTAQAGI